jgi:hypothetical protein
MRRLLSIRNRRLSFLSFLSFLPSGVAFGQRLMVQAAMRLQQLGQRLFLLRSRIQPDTAGYSRIQPDTAGYSRIQPDTGDS